MSTRLLHLPIPLRCYDLVEPDVQRGFFRKIAADGIQVEIESNGVHYE